MSKKALKSTEKNCTKCGMDAGLLRITLPRNVYLRPRTEKESLHLMEKEKTGDLTGVDLHWDVQRRRLKLCPTCIIPYRKENGPKNVQTWGR